MKELTIQEKAKRYDEALEVARTLLNTRCIEGTNGYFHRKDIEQMFPSLAENEDEKMRKELAEYFRWNTQQLLNNFNNKEVLAWIEKQTTPKRSPKWLYRLEYKDGSCGLWYSGNGEWCFEKGIGSLDDSCTTKSLPMGYDERYKQDGRDWFSSCSNKEDLLHWYSKKDAKTLLDKGFVFTRYLATEYHEYENETVFIKETSLFREEVDFFNLMEESKPRNSGKPTWDEIRDWFKANYPPQKQWKPNGDQLDALYDMLRSFRKDSTYKNRDDIAKIVEEFLEQLKTL